MKLAPHTDNVVSFLPTALILVGLARYPLAEHWSSGRPFIAVVLWLTTSAFVLYWLRSDHALRGSRPRSWLAGLSIFPLLQLPVLAVYLAATRRATQRFVAVGLMFAFYAGCFLCYAGAAGLGRRWFL